MSLWMRSLNRIFAVHASCIENQSSRKHTYIILTPLNPILCSKTGVYRDIHYFSYFCSKTDYGYSLEPPLWGGSNEYPQSMFWAEIWKTLDFFYRPVHYFFQFLLKNIDCGYSWRFSRVPTIYVLSRNFKNIRFFFYLKILIFWWWNFQYIWIGLFSLWIKDYYRQRAKTDQSVRWAGWSKSLPGDYDIMSICSSYSTLYRCMRGSNEKKKKKKHHENMPI